MSDIPDFSPLGAINPMLPYVTHAVYFIGAGRGDLALDVYDSYELIWGDAWVKYAAEHGLPNLSAMADAMEAEAA